MLDKRIYTKAIAISEEDLLYIKELRVKKEFGKKSLAGILSIIINKNKKYNGLTSFLATISQVMMNTVLILPTGPN